MVANPVENKQPIIWGLSLQVILGNWYGGRKPSPMWWAFCCLLLGFRIIIKKMKNTPALFLCICILCFLPTPHKADAAIVCDGGCGASQEYTDQLNRAWCSTTYQNSIFSRMNGNERICECRVNYEWNNERTVCEIPQKSKTPSIIIPPTPQTRCAELEESFIGDNRSYNSYIRSRLSNNCAGEIPVRAEDQTCQNIYGNNSAWSGRQNENDGPICDCMTGYLFDDIKNTCVAEPVTPIEPPETPPTLTDDQICEEKYESAKSIVAPDGTKSCECRHGYVWNSDKTTCIYTPLSSTTKRVSRIENPITPESVNAIPVFTKSAVATSTALEVTIASSSISSTTQKEAPVRQGFWARVIKWFGFK